MAKESATDSLIFNLLSIIVQTMKIFALMVAIFSMALAQSLGAAMAVSGQGDQDCMVGGETMIMAQGEGADGAMAEQVCCEDDNMAIGHSKNDQSDCALACATGCGNALPALAVSSAHTPTIALPTPKWARWHEGSTLAVFAYEPPPPRS